MTSSNKSPNLDAGTPLDSPIAKASASLRVQADARALQIAPAVLSHIFSQPRRSQPVRGRGRLEYIRVSEQVLSTLIGQHINGSIEGVAVGGVVLTVDLGGQLEEVNLELVGQYGHSFMRIADEVRAVVRTVLDEVLGNDGLEVRINTTHLHFSDVSLGDPMTHDPNA